MPRLLIALVVMLALTGCESGPQPPLLSPIAQAGRYGYADKGRGGDGWEVTYVAPLRRTTRFEPDRNADATAGGSQAYDFALWRAAQIAQEKKFAGFRVVQSRTNTDTYSDDYWNDPFYGGWGPWGRRRAFWPYPPYPYPSAYAWMQPRVSLDIELRNDLAPGDYAAADVIDQLKKRYPNAELPNTG